MTNDRKGYGVKITRDDGTSFLACSGNGILPAVFTLAQRKFATALKYELKTDGLNAEVVRVTFSDVRVDGGGES